MSKNLPVYLSYLLRHHPEDARLNMDIHGWVGVTELIQGVNHHSNFQLDDKLLDKIVSEDDKGRFRYNETHTRIKCCQGHSIPWIEPELAYGEPPLFLFHGTTTIAMNKIDASGSIKKMKRHAVHLQQAEEKAWQSAKRWHLVPVLLKVNAEEMFHDGYVFGMADNGVWCTDNVPVKYISERLYLPDALPANTPMHD